MAEESYPPELKYHPEHDWARVDGDVATCGITWYAQEQLGEVVFFDPPDVGTSVSMGKSYAEVESVKAVSDVIAPLSGEVTSGTLSPCLNQGIGMAYLPAGESEPGTAFEIDVRGRTRPAEVRAKPLYRKEG